MAGLQMTPGANAHSPDDLLREQLSAMMDGALPADESRFLLRRMQVAERVFRPLYIEATRIAPDTVRLARASTIVTLGHGEGQVVPQDSGREGCRTRSRGGAAGRAVSRGRGKARQTVFLGGDRPS